MFWVISRAFSLYNDNFIVGQSIKLIGQLVDFTIDGGEPKFAGAVAYSIKG